MQILIISMMILMNKMMYKIIRFSFKIPKTAKINKDNKDKIRIKTRTRKINNSKMIFFENNFIVLNNFIKFLYYNQIFHIEIYLAEYTFHLLFIA